MYNILFPRVHRWMSNCRNWVQSCCKHWNPTRQQYSQISPTTIAKPGTLCPENLIGCGIFSKVYRYSDTCVRKFPLNDDPDNIQSIRNEATIYNIIGVHDRIIECMSVGQTTDYVDLRWASNGNLEQYVQSNKDQVTDGLRLRWIRQFIESVDVLHRKDIVHSDLALRQWLLDGNLDTKLSDFGASSYPGQDALGEENASHYLPRDPDFPNTVQSDIFALGCTIYELVVGYAPYYGKQDHDIESLYKQQKFPTVDNLLCGQIMKKCWRRRFVSTAELLLSFDEFFLHHVLEQTTMVGEIQRHFYSLRSLFTTISERTKIVEEV